MKNECYIVRDILPLYLEDMVSEETAAFIKEHLEHCPACAAELAAMVIGMQKGYTDMCCIYDMRTANAPFCPLFSPLNHKPIHGYYSLVAFNHLYKLGTEVETICDTDELYAVAASDGEHHAMMISNLTGSTQPLEFEGIDLSNARWHVIDQARMLSWSPAVNRIKNNSVLLIEF